MSPPVLDSANAVTIVPAAPSLDAAVHFGSRLAFETDCADVHAALASGRADDFVLVDVRSPEAFVAGHIDGAVNLPHRSIDAAAVAAHPHGITFVVYCAGPHCNGADQAALALARLDRPVKKMIGGVTGWVAEGFPLVAGD